MIQKKWILPVLRTIAHRGEKNAAFVLHAGPSAWIGMTFVASASEFAGVDGQYDVKVRRKIFKGIPLLVEFDRGSDAFEAGEFRIVDDEVGGLQARVAAVSDELTADHAQIRIGLYAVSDIAGREIRRVRLGMDRVAGGVNAGKSHAALNGIEKSLFACWRHRRIFVGA